MGVLPLILLGLLAQVYAGPGDNAFDIGNSRWGWDLVVTTPPRECAPMTLWYNVSAAGGIPDFSVLPDHAAVDFLTPESAEDVWMTLRPPMGQGILSWTVPLRAGKQFLIRNHQGYKTVVTVGTPTDGTSCGQDAAQVTGTSSFGELRMATFNRLRSQTYASYSIADSSQFRSTSFPSGGTVRNVPLGAAVPVQTTPVKEPVTEPSGPTDPSPDPNDGDDENTTTPGGSTPGGTATTPVNDDNETTPAVTSGGTGSNNFATPTSPAEQQGGDNASSGGKNNGSTNNGSTNNGSSGNGGSTDDSQAKQPLGDSDGNGSNDKSGGGSNIGAIIGGILGALLAGVLIGVFCVCLHRRRRRQRRFAAPLEVTPIPPPMAESTESIAATGGAFSGLAAYDTAVYASDRKNAALFTDDDPSGSNRDSLGATTAVWTETRRSFFGGLSDVPSSDQQSRIEESDNGTLVPPPRAAVPPPKYSRFG